MKNCLILSISILLLVSVSGCGVMGLRPEVHVLVLNKSGIELTDTRVTFGDHVCKWGVVAKNGDVGFMFYPHPITPRVDFLWNEGGKNSKIEVDLRDIYPPGASGRLTFIFYGDRVVPVYEKK